MNPFDQPVNTSPQSPTPTGAQQSASGGLNLGTVNTGPVRAKQPVEPSTTPARGLAGIPVVEETEKILLPVAAAAGAMYNPESFIGKKLLTLATGFKVGEAGEVFNKVTPGAALFLLPEPIGALPEVFFQKKPQIPGTGVYLDPLYNYTRYKQRKEDRDRAIAGEYQLTALATAIIPATDDQVRTILTNIDLRKTYLEFADPRKVDRLLLNELKRRNDVAQLKAARSFVDTETEEQHRANTLAEAVRRAVIGDSYGAEALVSYLENRAALASTTLGGSSPVIGAVVLSASIPLQLIPALTATAQAQRQSAKGIRKELVTEMIDP